MNYQTILQTIADEAKNSENLGQVATYIPELKHVDPSKLGIHLTTVSNQHFYVGDSNESFSIQSISKVLALTLALKLQGEKIWSRVGVEPSGSPFNSLVQLEYENGIPRNPFINAGAIVICDILISSLADPEHELLAFIRGITNNEQIDYCVKTKESELNTGFRNFALANLMKDYGNIRNHIDDVLSLYFSLCSIRMTCKELAQTFLYLAADGVSPITQQRIVSSSQAKRINAVMLMCGFYDEAGEFAFCTGLPGKSGVGGGIAAVHPGHYSIVVWSPKLNKKGNSYLGMKMLEQLTTLTQSSIF